MQPHPNQWDEYAEQYARWLNDRDRSDPQKSPILARLLEALGDVSGRDVLDAGCGEGFLARVLDARGARVTGIDLSPRLIEMGRAKDPRQTIDYRVGDLSRPVPDLAGRFDCIGSYLALNDVADHRGFAASLATLVKPGGCAAFAFNNPYSLVIREHLTDYFATDATPAYGGLGDAGVKVRYYHRTLEEYLDAFLMAGWRLVKLADVPDYGSRQWLLPPECRFPLFMILAFEKAPSDGARYTA